MTITRNLRVAIVGAGGWGEQHARAFAARNDVDLCGICSRNGQRAADRAKRYHTHAYTAIDAMLDTEKPDLVTVCLPNREHFAPTMQLIERGVPLLVEKPLVFALDEADRLVAAAESRHLFVAINFNHRYARPLRLAKEAIVAGRLGEPVFATWRFGGEGGACDRHDNLIETQCHGFDQLEWLCGPIASVMAQMRAVGTKGPSTMAIALAFANQAVGSLVGSYDASYAHPGTHALEIVGTAGRLTVTDTVKRFTFHANGSETGEVWEAGYFNDRDRTFVQTVDLHFDAVLAALRAGQPPPVPITAGRRVLRLAHASIESWQRGQRVTVAQEG